ncbi:MAG: S-adenosylmethionine:tRNA ribosyltransferase-isomerase [Bacteroidales bacterium]
MDKDTNYDIADFDYELPSERIARYPLKNRDTSRLLFYHSGIISDNYFSKAPELLPADSLLVFNNTRVIHARMNFFKETGAHIEIFCLEPIQPPTYETVFAQHGECTWKCIVGNAKKWKDSVLTLQTTIDGRMCIVTARKVEKTADAYVIRFMWDVDVSFSAILESVGEIPIPPYLQRRSESIDSERYQTVYAQHEGSVAAPTAGLHFTDTVLEKIHSKGIIRQHVVLHVGAGTFKPVQENNYTQHVMHRECCIIEKEVIQLIIEKKMCVAVGTTSVRTLESLYWLGVKLISSHTFNPELYQWDAYELPQNISVGESCTALLEYMKYQDITVLHAYTQLMIMPGYTFRMVDAMFTNFHQPKSTLLLLVAAFVGEDWKKIYNHAHEKDYRFLSYGDSMLLMP